MLDIQPQRLTREAFAPFGDVIEIEGSEQFEINSGYTTRVHDRSTSSWVVRTRGRSSAFSWQAAPSRNKDARETSSG